MPRAYKSRFQRRERVLREDLEKCHSFARQGWSNHKNCFCARIWVGPLYFPYYGLNADSRLRPFPYHPIGSAKTHSQVADEEGQRLQVLFNDFAATLNDA
jgi:hypothetical protein